MSMEILLLSNSLLNEFDQTVLGHIKKYPELKLCGALINIRKKPGALQRIKRELRKGRGGYVLVQMVNTLVGEFARNKSIRARDFSTSQNIPFYETSTLYSKEVEQWINLIKPDILLLRGFGIIKEPILSIAPFGVLSYHHADIKKYRGGPPVFWELFNGEKEIGVTVQLLDAGLDTGTIVIQKILPISKADTLNSLRMRVYKESESMAAEALLALSKTGPFRNPVGVKGKLYSLPDLRQWIYLQFKILKSRVFA